MKNVLILIPLLLTACTQNVIDDSPKYAGARGSSAEGGGASQLIRGETNAVGCGVGTSEEPLPGRVHISIRTNECTVDYTQEMPQ